MKAIYYSIRRCAVVLSIAALITTAAMAVVPGEMNYQGRLTDSAGVLLNGTPQMTFTIYDAASVPLWTEIQPSVFVKNGLFSVQLGSVNPIPPAIFDGSTRFLGIAVAGDPEMTPRFPLTTVPYAFRAENASVNYAQVFTVALSGGDFTSINAALAACAPGLRYLIRVMPGNYPETVDLYTAGSTIHLKGAGRNVTTIQGSVRLRGDSLLQGFRIEQGVECWMTIPDNPTILLNTITNDARGDFATKGDGIYVHESNPWIKENIIFECYRFGVYCDGPDANPWILANIIADNGQGFDPAAPDLVGGIRCDRASPTISNNKILRNNRYGIHVGGSEFPAEPTIDDNVIAYTIPQMPDVLDNPYGPNRDGVGIQIGDVNMDPVAMYAEPRVYANDMYKNSCAIRIEAAAQPSIHGNNINYNDEEGIVCLANPASKDIVIKSNYLHSNGQAPGIGMNLGIANDSRPIVTHNNFGDLPGAPGLIDIHYAYNFGGVTPVLSYNVYNVIVRNVPVGTGNYNTDRNGAMINP
ncbi:MAG: right-handed parallel beta-helix repeat-containing protein [Oceanipulchritudo sp.]